MAARLRILQATIPEFLDPAKNVSKRALATSPIHPRSQRSAEEVPQSVPQSGPDDRRLPFSGDGPGSVPRSGPDDTRPFLGDGPRSVPQFGPDDL